MPGKLFMFYFIKLTIKFKNTKVLCPIIMLIKERSLESLGSDDSFGSERESIDFVVKSAAWFLLKRKIPFENVQRCISYELSSKSPEDILKAIPFEYKREFENLKSSYSNVCDVFYNHFKLEKDMCERLDYMVNDYLAKL